MSDNLHTKLGLPFESRVRALSRTILDIECTRQITTATARLLTCWQFSGGSHTHFSWGGGCHGRRGAKIQLFCKRQHTLAETTSFGGFIAGQRPISCLPSRSFWTGLSSKRNKTCLIVIYDEWHFYLPPHLHYDRKCLSNVTVKIGERIAAASRTPTVAPRP